MTWIRDTLGITLWEKQVEIVNSLFMYHDVAVRSGHGVGKSYVAAVIALTFISTMIPSIVVTTAPTYKQVRNILWEHINGIYKRSKMPRTIGGRINILDYRLTENHYAIGFTTRENKLEDFQGYHSPNILLIFDEAPGIASAIWTAAASILTTNAYFLTIGNPTSRVGEFFNRFRDPDVYKIHISCFDSPNVTGEMHIEGLTGMKWIDGRKKAWGEDSILYLTKVIGDFPKEDYEHGIPLSWIESCFDAEVAG